MDRSRVTIPALALLSASVFNVAAAQSPGEAIRVFGLSGDQTAIVEHAIELYEHAGLPLPPVTIGIGSGLPGCVGEPLAIHRRGDDRSEIYLCYPEISGRELRVLLHELGHAWATIGLTEQRRRAFQEHRGWDHWRNYDVADWSENGTEQAAEILKWGTSDVPTPVFIEHDSCEELREGYRVLTGSEPPHGHTGTCDPPAAGAAQPDLRPVWPDDIADLGPGIPPPGPGSGPGRGTARAANPLPTSNAHPGGAVAHARTVTAAVESGPVRARSGTGVESVGDGCAGTSGKAASGLR